jgi:hypothetical protein
MKKGLGLLLAGALMLGTVPTVAEASLAPSYVSVIVDGKKVWFPDAHPFVNSDYRTMVPVRFITESLGADVKWLGETQTVAIQYKGKDIKLRVGEWKATVDGVEKALDTAVMLHNNRTFVPLRFVTETLGGEVTWDGKTQSVQIKTEAYDENAQYDRYGRKIRTTNLPKNYHYYPYILEDIPNEMYEMRFVEEPGGDILTPANLLASDPEQITQENIDLWMERVRKHFNLLLNVDYRTIDNRWAEELYSYRNQGVDHLYFLEDYVKWVKENEIQIEGYADPEPSMILDATLGYRARARIKFRILNYKTYDTLIYDRSFKNAGPFEKGVWYNAIVDIELSTNHGGNWGKYLMVSSIPMLFDNAIIRKVE